MTAEEIHIKKLKDLGYKEAVIENIVKKFHMDQKYLFAESIHTEKIKLLKTGLLNKTFPKVIESMKQFILDDLSKLDKGYGKRKSGISENTGIPIDILTVLLKQLKNEGKIELIMIWSESTGLPNGSGYCLSGNLY